MSATKVTAATHRTELAENGYAKIEAKIQKIENLAYNGVFTEVSRTSRFQQIGMEVKQLRQILREVLVIVPVPADGGGKGDAA